MCHVTLYNRQVPVVVTTLLPRGFGRPRDLWRSRLEIPPAHGKTRSPPDLGAGSQVRRFESREPATRIQEFVFNFLAFVPYFRMAT